MKYNIFSSSVVGYKNKFKNKGSQDYLRYKNLEDGVICAIGDGHGIRRCKYSYKGSEFACNACIDILTDLYIKIKDTDENSLENLVKELRENESIQKNIQQKWRQYVIEHYKTKIPNVYDVDYVLYGTTLIGVLLVNNIKLYLQIGDGDIVEYTNQFNLVEYNKDSKVYGVLNSMYLDDAYKYIDLKIDIINKSDIDALVMFSDGFTNSFKTYKELSNSLRYTINQYRKNVFTRYNVNKTYKKYLEILSTNNSKDDISIIFVL
ncbi:hypothetical protein GCM10008904_25680 [Paraclostridium ghonii]|uniref:Serine/threonine protein phosphatase PrpC n=1 Tax=Paraclostridium ghonii TaxID=29358 RepID=A0ABU0MYT3_9FIRM|nr:protein phosphatase 2C domain-containing protein [Paeniclostridium ghonii]MDQ0556081.1 serine/threonine protein phosphatase PrpC [Paeniclostridium ghonii]